MKLNNILSLLTLATLLGCAKVSSPKYPDVKWDRYKGSEETIKEYLDKNAVTLDPIEGIYSISAEHHEKFFLGLFTEKTGQADDFARVAIIKDNKSFNAQFIEVIIRGEDLPKYAITADFTRVQRSLSFLSRQFAPNGSVTNYTFEYNEKSGILEGYRQDGDKTSRLTYLKLYPVRE